MKHGFVWKSVLIVSVVVVFLYGIFGLPHRLTGRAVAASIVRRIHLGLDLKGGTHLILQVEVNDAVRADAQQAIELLKSSLQKRNIPFSSITEPDPKNNPNLIQLTGIPLNEGSAVRDIASRHLP